MIFYIKYGELTLKGKNKRNFVNCLYGNMQKALSSFKEVKVIKQYDNAVVSGFTDSQIDEIQGILVKIPGISFVIKAFESSTDLQELGKDICEQIPKEFKTFKVFTSRSDKNYPLDSMQISRKMGGIILDFFQDKVSVDVHKPELKVNIEIKHNKSVFYFNKMAGIGGFPLGINGKVLMLISGGIDSPVASALLMKKGFHVDFLTFITPPHTNPKVLDKTKKLVEIVTLEGKLEKPKLYVVNFTNLQNELAHMSNKTYQITLMRRYFFRIARDIANKYEYDAIGTGESLGQVASQTIESMSTIQNAIGDFLVLRPLLTYDKIEIIRLANMYGTYETSIIPFIDCCALFVPTNPTTKPSVKTAEKLEEELELADSVYQRIMEKYLTII